MTDNELIAGFEAGTLEHLPHANHVRLALLYLEQYGRDEALRRLGDGLLLFATLKGHPEKFHVTMTRAWLEPLAAARAAQPGGDPAAFVSAWPEVLDARALRRFYSAGLLDGDAARTSWLEPDLAPLDPRVLRGTGSPLV
ncbi:MAG: hypothetical protein H0X67_23385 [Acidobacteria bacterium]|nr:hypothetical protein [Acidobacteriota bacterium]